MWANAQRDGRPAEYRCSTSQFGRRPLLECRAATLLRRETVEICRGAANSPTVLSR